MLLAQSGDVSVVVPIPTDASGPGATTFAGGEGGVLYTYIGTVFAWLAGITGTVLLLFVIYYGFLLMFAGIEDKREDAKKGLLTCCGGLFLLMCAGLVLYTLNPTFFVGFGKDDGGGAPVLGTVGTGGPPATKPPVTPPATTPGTAGDSAVGACEAVGVTKRGDAAEPVTQRPDVNPQNIAAKKQRFGAQLQAAVGQPGIDPAITVDLMAALMQQENSGADPDRVSSAGAIGIMQVLPAAAEDYCGIPRPRKDELRDIQTNMNCTAKMLTAFHRQAVSRYGRTEALRSTIAAYNGGPGRLAPSNACSGTNACGQPVTQWECLWDDTAHTRPNHQRPGTNLVETRNYVMSVLRGMGICPDVAAACR